MMTKLFSRPFATALPILTSAVLLMGCGGAASDPNRPATAPVSGIVTLGGNPVEGATVTFQAQGGENSAFGQTDAQGRYQLTTFETADGAVPGNYTVTIRKTEWEGGNAVPESDPNYGKQPEVAPTLKFIVPEKYSDPKKSELSATVSEGENDIPFELE